MPRENCEMLRKSIRSLLTAHWPVETAVDRSLRPEELRKLWGHLLDMGVTQIGADAEAGGLEEALVVAEELGRAGCPAPMIDTLIANMALADQPAAAAFRALIGRGDAIVSVGFGQYDGDDQAGAIEIADGTVSGALNMIETASVATHLLTYAGHSPKLVIVPLEVAECAPAPGLSVPALSTVKFYNATVEMLAFSNERIEDLNLIARMALAARASGAARRGFELVTEYVKQRRQFGQPIGRFQAIQHKLANSIIGLDGASLTLANAAAFHDRGSADWHVFASAAVAFAGPALRQISLETQHCFGAIGYSEEHEAPRHFRRIHADLARCGGVRRAREELATYLLGPKS